MKNKIVSSTCGVFALTMGCLLAGCQSNEQKTKSLTEHKMTNIFTSESGLKREIIKAAPADAVSPQRGQRTTVHYTGWLENGKQFDSSVGRGPFTFVVGVGQVIKGWDEGVLAMKVGEKCRLTIPASIGYGARGAGHAIPPNSTLIFEVELLSVA